ncbi:unnamed protein product [Phytomonas sp. EM1]|nr:unnamed protein product [Phytomonas sp. EM1]|eukprot:CCW60427.1 unnamed protein product [Phytomonas sp. isolate EM1]
MRFRELQRHLTLVFSAGYAELGPPQRAACRSMAACIRFDGILRRAANMKTLCLYRKLNHAIGSGMDSGSWPAIALLTTRKGICMSSPLYQGLSKPDSEPSPSASTHSPKGDVEVALELIAELTRILARFPESTWLPISNLYNELPTKMRREYVRPHRSLFQVLLKSQSVLGIHLDPSGIYCARGEAPAEPSKTSPEPIPVRENPAPRKEARASTPPRTETRAASPPAPSPPPSPSPSVPSVSPSSSSLGPAPVDFYYDVGLTTIPPPPADFDVTPSSLPVPQATADGTVLSLRDFVPFIPPFFVPLDEVLAQMTGYTEQHILNFFNAKAMEMVQIAGQRFIRLYGGYANISLEGCEDAEETFQMYKPRTDLLPAFVKAFEGIQEKWMPLTVLLKRADPEAVAQLNPKGPASIIYFAQMQHVFGFSVVSSQGGDAEDESSSPSSSVLLRKQPYTGLTCETTPTPKSVNFILQRVPIEGIVDVHMIQGQLTPSIREEIDTYYGDIFGFFKAHATVFFLTEDHTVVMRTRYRNRMQVASLPLEEQLRIALENRDKRKARAIRRRIAFRDNPSHPFHDPDNLAREVAKYLPHHGFVSLKMFLRTNIPEEVLYFMPAKINNFFANYPQYFQRFEYQTAGTWCICRPGNPLPRGVIRQHFSEDDLLRLIAEFLQRCGGPRACANIYLNIPHGAQEVLRKRYGGLYYFVEKYPQYFSIVLGLDTGNMKSGAVVHLISLPNTLKGQREKGTAGESGDGLSDDDGEHACHTGQGNDVEEDFDCDH